MQACRTKKMAHMVYNHFSPYFGAGGQLYVYSRVLSSIVTFICIYNSSVKDFVWKLEFTDKSTVFKKIVKTTALEKSKTYIPQVSTVKFNHLPGDCLFLQPQERE